MNKNKRVRFLFFFLGLLILIVGVGKYKSFKEARDFEAREKMWEEKIGKREKVEFFDLNSALKNKNEVKRLNLSGKNLVKISPRIGELTNLNYLDISNNKLSDLPSEVSKLSKLYKVSLGGNRFKKFPSALLGLDVEIKGFESNPIENIEKLKNPFSNIDYSTIDINPDSATPKNYLFYSLHDLQDGKLRIFTEMGYHNMASIPCGGRPPLKSQQETLKYYRENCNTDIYAHGKGWVEKLKIENLELGEGHFCQDNFHSADLKFKPLNKTPLFFTTHPSANLKNDFTPSKNLKVDVWPGAIDRDKIKIPYGYGKPSFEIIRYPNAKDNFIIFAQARGYFNPRNTDIYGPNKTRNWTGIYYSAKNEVKLLSDSNIHAYYLGDSRENLLGLIDFNSDGRFDILVGDPVSLILENIGDSFRPWGFGFYPGGGC